MNLWIFGDSFSVSLNKHTQDNGYVPLEDNWQTLLSKNLDVNFLDVSATWGVSNEWIWTQVAENAEQFTENDYVIIQSTSFNRFWLLNQHPEYSNFMLSPIDKGFITKDQSKAIEMFKRHLYHEDVFQSIYNMFVNACKQIGIMMPHVKILILPGFHEIQGVTGTLMDICINEFESNEIADKFYKHHSFDYRVNHMHKFNHKILADKISNYFNGYELDLTNGFYQKFITNENYKKILDS